MRSNGPVSEKSRRLTRLSLRVELARVCRSPCRLTRPRSSRRATDSRPSASLFGALSSDLARGYAALVPRRRDPQRPVAGSRAHQPRSDGGVVPAVSKGVGERGDVHARQQGREAAAERRSGRRDGGGRDGATVKASLEGDDVRTPRCHSAQAQTRLDRFAPVVRGMFRPRVGTDTDKSSGSNNTCSGGEARELKKRALGPPPPHASGILRVWAISAATTTTFRLVVDDTRLR